MTGNRRLVSPGLEVPGGEPKLCRFEVSLASLLTASADSTKSLM